MLNWIDSVKAICMIGVYLLHSQAYYGTGGVDYGRIIMPFYVNAFFFVSGYLLFRKYLSNKMLMKFNGGGYLQAIQTVLFRLVIPTILFSTLIYLPKAIFHGTNFSIEDFAFNILGGVSFWFTSALTVAQIILFTLLLSKQRNMVFYVLITGALFVCGLALNMNHETDGGVLNHFPWFYNTGMEYTFIMALGGAYWRYECVIDKKLKRWGLLLIGGIYCLIVSWSFYDDTIKYIGLGGKVTALGFVGMVCGIAIVIALCKQLPRIGLLEFVGRNSIVFYFFSGVFPAAIGAMTHSFYPNTSYLITILVAAIALSLGWLTTKLVVKYLPFLTDLRKLRQK